MGFLDPEALFFRKWGFGALSGVGGIPTQANADHLCRRLKTIEDQKRGY